MLLLSFRCLPFVGFLINASLGRRLGKPVSGGVAVRGDARLVRACRWPRSWRLVALPAGIARASRSRVYTWISSGDFTAAFTLRARSAVVGDDSGASPASAR